MLTEARSELDELAKEHLEAHRGEIFRDVWASFSGIDGYVSSRHSSMHMASVFRKTDQESRSWNSLMSFEVER